MLPLPPSPSPERLHLPLPLNDSNSNSHIGPLLAPFSRSATLSRHPLVRGHPVPPLPRALALLRAHSLRRAGEPTRCAPHAA